MALSKLRSPIDDIIPDDIIVEILSRLEPDDLLACLGVNHKFNDIISDPGFKSRRTRTLSGYLTHDGRTYSFVPDQATKGTDEVSLLKCDVVHKLEILSSRRYITVEAVSQFRGLICCVDGKLLNRRYYVCKPATGQCRSLPNPKLRFETTATGIVSSLSGQEFKIVRFSLPRGRSSYLCCEVFNSRAWRWHRCNDIKEDIFFPSNWRRDGAVFAQGSIHWLTQHGIFAFNMYNETWKCIDLPPEYADLEINHRAKITMQDRKLSLVHIKDDAEVVVWRMDNYIEAKWGPQQAINFTRSRPKDNWLRSFLELFYSSSCGPDCLFNNNWKGIWKDNLDALDAIESFLGGDVFRFESDATPCKALQQIA